jgi:hypothetical protein
MLRRLTLTLSLVRARRPFRLARLLPILLALAMASSACTSGPKPGERFDLPEWEGRRTPEHFGAA